MNTTGTSSVRDVIDASLLDRLQTAVPLERRPFATVAQTLGIAEQECLDRVRRLKAEAHVIRQISAIFDTQSLGYASSLVAASYPADRLEASAAVVAGHPGVSHCYERSHRFNLWYTLAVSPDSRLGLQGTVDFLHARSGALVTRLLPTLKLFKIGVKIDVGAESASSDESAPAFTDDDRRRASAFAVTDADKQMIRVLQEDLPLESQPFDVWAKAAGCTADDLLAAARRYLERRQMRRFAAVLRHREAGMNANVMACWNVAPDCIDQVGAAMASFRAVSHCYRRPCYEDWPYSVFTMVHARDRDEAQATLQAMRDQSGIADMVPLWSLREFKKTRVRYFTLEADQWERTMTDEPVAPNPSRRGP